MLRIQRQVTLKYPVKGYHWARFIYCEGWLGLLTVDGIPGDKVILDVSEMEIGFALPRDFNGIEDDKVYVDIKKLNEHELTDECISKHPVENAILLGVLLEDQGIRPHVTKMMIVQKVYTDELKEISYWQMLACRGGK